MVINQKVLVYFGGGGSAESFCVLKHRWKIERKFCKISVSQNILKTLHLL